MTASTDRNGAYLRRFFTGQTHAHAIIMNPIEQCRSPLGDFTLSDAPVSNWRDWALGRYEAQLRWHEAVGDDSVPYVVSTHTNTAIFAAAMGSPVHVYDGMETNAAARPAVGSAAQADALPEPSIDDSPTLRRTLELAHMMADALGPEAPVARAKTKPPARGTGGPVSSVQRPAGLRSTSIRRIRVATLAPGQ